MSEEKSAAAGARGAVYVCFAILIALAAGGAILWAAFEGPRREAEAQRIAREKYDRMRAEDDAFRARMEAIRAGEPR